MHRSPTWSALAALLLLVPLLLPAQRTETTYVPNLELISHLDETRYDGPSRAAAAVTLSGVDERETRYNPKGTLSTSAVGLVSLRRDAADYPAFLLGLQDAAIASSGSPLNVAPLSADTPQEQVDLLAARGVSTFLVDSPHPMEAEALIQRNREGGRTMVLIAQALPRGFFPPLVVDTPILHAERAGEESIRLVGNNPVTIAYIYENYPEELPTEDLGGAILRAFRRPFDNVAPEINLEAFDPARHLDPGNPPAVVVALTAEDSARHALTLRERFPDSRLVLVGESPEVLAACERGDIDVRVRPDYARLLAFAMSEAREKSPVPLVLHGTADRLIW